ncbi:MAG: (Fe-S)-binding protein [Candidatus Lokiarchaeota archaeon]|nr:(Fe-S)-binding protein [Candidatus Lokiarchaeota archaeon]
MTQAQQVPPELSKKLERVKELANYCYSCGKCLVVCPTHLLGIFSPKDFIHNLVTHGVDDLDVFIQDEKLFNCLTCEQCAIYCPMASDEAGEGVLIAEIVQGIREYGYHKDLLTEELTKGSTHDGIMQLYPKLQSESDLKTNDIGFIKNDSSLKITESGEIAYFIGCTSLLDDIFYQFRSQYKNTPRGVITILNEGGITPVVLETKCCGHDNYWVGDIETAKKLAQYNVNQYKKSGVKTIIVECAEGYRMWKFDYPKLVDNCDFEVKHFSEFLIEQDLLHLLGPRFPVKARVTYHDPCRLGRLGGKVYDAPRKVLKSIPGIELIEMKAIRDDANCCGVSTFRSCNSNTKILRENRINEAIDTDAEYLITTCPKCITHFNCYLNETDDEGNEKPESIKVMDLAAFIAKYTQKI